MDFRFDVLKALRPDRQGISILKGTDKPSREINMIIDTFGDLSSRS